MFHLEHWRERLMSACYVHDNKINEMCGCSTDDSETFAVKPYVWYFSKVYESQEVGRYIW